MATLDGLFPPPPDDELIPGRTALLDVDVQNAQVYGLAEKVRKAGLCAVCDEYDEEVLKILPRIRALKDACRRAGIEVIHLRCASYTGDGRDGCALFRSADVTEQGGADAAAIVAEVAPEPGEIVITKISTAAFNGSDLDTVLRNRRIDTLLITGLVTDGCVEGTMRGAADRGYRVFLIEDAAASWTRAQHRAAVRTLGRWSARVLDTETLLRRIAGQDRGARARPADTLGRDPSTSGAPEDPHVALRRFWRGFPPVRLTPADTALLILDAQYLTCHPDYGLGRRLRERGLADLAERYFEAVERMVQNLARLLEAGRAAGLQVAYSHLSAHTTDSRDAPEQMRRLGLYAARGSKEAQILDQLAPQPHDLVLPRTTLSAFTPRAGDQLLRNLGIDTLVIAGTLTDAAVASSARDASDRGYRTVVVDDACAALAPEDHRAALAPIGLWYGHVVVTDTVVTAIRTGTVVAG